jgi:ATP-dependent helicase/DNAse subunit B
VLGEQDILTAMNNSLSPKYLLGAKIDSKGNIKGSATVSADRFNEIFKELEGVIIKIADRLEGGDISAKPIKTKNSPCKYCSAKPICRNIQN